MIEFTSLVARESAAAHAVPPYTPEQLEESRTTRYSVRDVREANIRSLRESSAVALLAVARMASLQLQIMGKR